MKDKKPLRGEFCKYHCQNFVVVGIFFKTIDGLN